MTQLRAPHSEGPAGEGKLVHAGALVGCVRVAGENFQVEVAYFDGFADLRLRRLRDRRLFGLRPVRGQTDVGLRVLVDVTTGADLQVESPDPRGPVRRRLLPRRRVVSQQQMRVMVLGDVLEAVPELGSNWRRPPAST